MFTGRMAACWKHRSVTTTQSSSPMRMVHQIMKLEHVLRSSYRVSGQHSTHEEHEAHDERDHDADGEHEEAGAISAFVSTSSLLAFVYVSVCSTVCARQDGDDGSM